MAEPMKFISVQLRETVLNEHRRTVRVDPEIVLVVATQKGLAREAPITEAQALRLIETTAEMLRRLPDSRAAYERQEAGR